jgi:hypothetical protein
LSLAYAIEPPSDETGNGTETNPLQDRASRLRTRNDPAGTLLIVTDLGGLVPRAGAIHQLDMVRKQLAT